MNLFEVCQEIINRLTRIYQRDENGRRPVYGWAQKVPNVIPTGTITFSSTNTSTVTTARALAPSHQTGWTGVIARLIDLFGRADAATLLEAEVTPYKEPTKLSA